MNRIRTLFACALLVLLGGRAAAQHTLGVTAAFGMSSARLDPKQEMKPIWGRSSFGLSWRYYGRQRVVGGFGIDLEFLQQGFSFAPNASTIEDEKDYRYYTRKLNTLVLPIVWQPHVYMFRRRVRIYGEAAATFSYNFSSTYENEVAKDAGEADWKGNYRYKTPRDNRWGYGLAGGGGIAVLIRQFELNFRVRYYFGYSDIVRARTKYADNTQDGPENPFWASPLRSPLDNLNISVGVSYRFNKAGFDAWNVRRPRREKNEETFNYKLN